MFADEIDQDARIGFSAELFEDCGPNGPSGYQHWLRETRDTKVPPGEFWFYVNNLQPDFEASTIGAARKRLGSAGQALTVRIKPRL